MTGGAGRTPLYYVGEQGLAAQIVALMPPHCVDLEPLAGGAAVLSTIESPDSRARASTMRRRH